MIMFDNKTVSYCTKQVQIEDYRKKQT